jgi:hypothetical protein
MCARNVNHAARRFRWSAPCDVLLHCKTGNNPREMPRYVTGSQSGAFNLKGELSNVVGLVSALQ